MRVFDAPLFVHYGQAYVFSGDRGDTGEMEKCFRGQTNGLLGSGQRGMLRRRTGRAAAGRVMGRVCTY
jgi:hypothetical protein